MTIETNRSVPMSSMNVLQTSAILKDDPSTIYLDIRIRSDYEEGHVPNSLNIPAFVRTEEGEMQEVKDGFLKQITKKIPDKSRRYLVGCTSGVLSVEASKWMLEAGYQQVINVAGGFTAWEASQFPIEKVHSPTFLSLKLPTGHHLIDVCANRGDIIFPQGPPTVDTLAEKPTVGASAAEFVPRGVLRRKHQLMGHSERVSEAAARVRACAPRSSGNVDHRKG
jgi:rhodanese-related sulfurtransferase